MQSNHTPKVNDILNDVENAENSKKLLPFQKISLKQLTLKLLSNIWVLFAICVIVAYLIIAPRLLTLNFTSRKSVLDVATEITFKITINMKITFELAEENSVDIIRGQYNIVNDNGKITYTFLTNIFTFAISEMIIRSNDFSKTKYIFICSQACHINTNFPKERASLDLDIQTVEGSFTFENVNFINIIMNSKKGSLYLKNSELGDSVFLLEDFQVVLVNDSDVDYQIYQFSTTSIIVTEAEYNANSMITKNTCPIYSDCFNANLENQPMIKKLSVTPLYYLIKSFFQDAKMNIFNMISQQYYADFLFTFDPNVTSPRVFFFIKNCKLLVVPPKIYNAPSLSSYFPLEIYREQNIYVVGFNVINMNKKFQGASNISSNTIFMTDLYNEFDYSQKTFNRITSTFLRKTHQDQFFFITILPFNIQFAFIKHQREQITLDRMELLEDMFTGVNEKMDINLPITSTSFSASNNFFNSLYFAQSIQKQLNSRVSNGKYQLLIKLNTSEMIEIAFKNVYFPETMYISQDLLANKYNLVENIDDNIYYFWPLIQVDADRNKKLMLAVKFLISSIPLLICMKLHYDFVSGQSKYFNKRRQIYNKLVGKEIPIETLPSNVLYRVANILFFKDYNQVTRYYYHACIGKYFNSLSRFCFLVFKKQNKKTGNGNAVNASNQKVSFKRFKKTYKKFCFVNDLYFQEINHIICETKFKEYNHGIVFVKDLEYYIKDLRLINNIDLEETQEDLSQQNIDSLDLFVNYSTYKLSNEKTKLSKFIEAYNEFCVKRKLENIKFNKEYLCGKYRLEVFQKQKPYIQSTNLSAGHLFKLNQEIFAKKNVNQKEVYKFLTLFDKEENFMSGLIRVIFKLSADLLLFQYLIMLVFFTLSNIQIVLIFTELYIDMVFPYDAKMSDCLLFLVIYVLYTIYNQINEKSLLESSIVTKKIPTIMIYTFAWVYIYYQKFFQFYFILEKVLEIIISWGFFDVKYNDYDIWLVFFGLLMILWISQLIIRRNAISRFNNHGLSIIRSKSVKYINLTNPDQLNENKPEGQSSGPVKEIFSNLYNLRELIKNRKDIRPDQYEILTKEFLNQLGFQLTAPLYKLLMLILQKNYDLKTLVEKLMDLSLSCLTQRVPEKTIPNDIYHTINLSKMILNELIIADFNKKSIFSIDFLSKIQHVSKNQQLLEHNAYLINMLEFFLITKNWTSNEALNLENFVMLDKNDYSMLKILKLLLNEYPDKVSSFWLARPNETTISLPTTIFREEATSKKADNFEKIMEFKIKNAKLQNKKFHCPSPKDISFLNEIINVEWKSQKNFIKENSIILIQAIKSFQQDIWNHCFGDILHNNTQNDVILPLSEFLLFLQLTRDVKMFKYYHPILENFGSNLFIVFLCKKFRMNFKEFLGMMFMIIGLHTEYNQHFIAFMCSIYNFERKKTFTMFIYSILNYRNMGELSLMQSKIPKEFIKLFLYFQSQTTALKENTLVKIAVRLNFEDEKSKEIFMDILRAKDINGYYEFKERNVLFCEQNTMLWSFLDLVVELSNSKRDRWRLFEIMKKLIDNNIKNKKFFVFFKQFFFLTIEMAERQSEQHFDIKDLTEKFLFIFPQRQSIYKYFEILFSEFSVINSDVLLHVAKKVVGPNLVLEKIFAVSNINENIKQRLNSMKSYFGHFRAFKKFLNHNSYTNDGKIISMLLENLLINRTKYNTKQTNILINKTFTIMTNGDQLIENRNIKLIKFFVALYKSLLTNKSFYLRHFIQKYHPNSFFLSVLISRYFGEEIIMNDIFYIVKNEIYGLNDKQRSTIQFYMYLLNPTVRFSFSTKLAYKSWKFDFELSYLIDVALKKKYNISNLLISFSNRITSKYDSIAKQKIRTFVNSFSVNLLLSVLQGDDEHPLYNKKFSPYNDFINNLVQTKKNFDNIMTHINPKGFKKIFEMSHIKNLFNILDIRPKEAKLILTFMYHQFNEDDNIHLFDVLKIPKAEQKILSTLIYIKRHTALAKSCAYWNTVLFASEFFQIIKYDPFVSWLIIFSIKKDYYDMVKLMKSKVIHLKSDRTFSYTSNLLLYFLFEEKFKVSQNIDFPSPKIKLVNCSNYYFWKLNHMDKRYYQWLNLNNDIKSYYSVVFYDSKLLPVVLCYLIVLYNLDNEDSQDGNSFFDHLIIDTVGKLTCKVLSDSMIQKDKSENEAKKDILEKEQDRIREHHIANLKQKLIVDISDANFVEYCRTKFGIFLFSTNPDNLYFLFNRFLINQFLKTIKDDLAYLDVYHNLSKRLKDKNLCCWKHPLTHLKEKCIKNLFLYYPCYENFRNKMNYLVYKKFQKASNLKVKANELRLQSNKQALPYSKEIFTMQIFIRMLVKLLSKLGLNSSLLNFQNNNEFVRKSKLLVILMETYMFVIEQKLFKKFEREFMIKFIELVFLKFSNPYDQLLIFDQRKSKRANDFLADLYGANSKLLTGLVFYIKNILTLELPVTHKNFKSILNSEHGFSGMPELVESEIVRMKQAKKTVRAFIKNCSFTHDRLVLLKQLCNYDCSYLKVEFRNQPIATECFPQESFNKIMLILNMKSTFNTFEKYFFKSNIISNFRSNSVHLIDLIKYLSQGYQPGMFKKQIGNSQETNLLCKVILNKEASYDNWINYNVHNNNIDQNFAEKFGQLIKFILNPFEKDLFAELSLAYYHGAKPDVAKLQLQKIQQLINNKSYKQSITLIHQSLSLIPNDFVSSSELEKVEHILQVLVGLIYDDFSHLEQAKDEILQVFYENFHLDNVQLIRLFALLKALKDKDSSIDSACSILYEFISFSQYDLTHVNLNVAKEILILLKFFMTGDYVLIFELFRRDIFKNEYTLLLSTYIYIHTSQIAKLDQNKTDYQNLIHCVTDHLFTKILKSNFVDKINNPEYESLILSLVNLENFLQESIYNFDYQKLEVLIRGLKNSQLNFKKDSIKINSSYLQANSTALIYNLSPEIKLLYYYFTDSPMLFYEENNLSSQQLRKIQSFDKVQCELWGSTSRYDKKMKVIFFTLFEQYSHKSHKLLKYLSLRQQMIDSMFDNQHLSKDLIFQFLNLLKQFDDTHINIDWHQIQKVIDFMLELHYEPNWNKKVFIISSYLQKCSIIEENSIRLLHQLFENYDFDFVFRLVCKLIKYSNKSSYKDYEIFEDLTIFMKKLKISEEEIRMFFITLDILSRERVLFSNWYSITDPSVPILTKQKEIYSQFVQEQKFLLAPPSVKENIFDHMRIDNIHQYLEHMLIKDQTVFTSLLLKFLELMHIKKDQNSPSIKQIFLLFYSFNKSAKYVVKSYFKQKHILYGKSHEKLTRIHFENLNDQIQDDLMTLLYRSQNRYWPLRTSYTFIFALIIIFISLFLVTLRFGIRMIEFDLKFYQIILALIGACKVIRRARTCDDSQNLLCENTVRVIPLISLNFLIIVINSISDKKIQKRIYLS